MVKESTVTPSQAAYVVEKLIAERKVSRADVQRYLQYMQTEIRNLEQKIASLRGHVPAAPLAQPSKAPSQKTTPKKRGRGRKGYLRGLAGTFAVLTRELAAADRAKYESIRSEKGLTAAVAELRKVSKQA